MKKFYLFVVALLAICYSTNSNAGTKVLYNANYETATDASAWVSPSASAGLSLVSDTEGKYIKFAPGNVNDRSAHTIWGTDVYGDAGFTETSASYHVEAEFCISASGTNHRTSEITVMTDQTTCTKNVNGNYRVNSKNWIFDMTELATGTAAAPIFCFNGDSTNTYTFTPGAFYYISLDVDTITRTVEWQILDEFKSKALISGTHQIPTATNPLAQGLYYLAGRYNNIAYFDNIQVSALTSTDVANKPTMSLTKIDGASRTYSISFMEGEILHFSFAGGSVKNVQYDDCDGLYSFTTSTSGTLSAYTTSGTATSETATVDIDASNISLPAANATITAVKSGYGKTYKLAVDNADVPTQPTLFIDYVFTPSNGGVAITATDLSSGATVALPSAGTLKVTTKAKGFTSTTTTIDNNIEYSLVKSLNLAQYTRSDATKAGYVADGTVTGNYSTYGRLYWYAADSTITKYTAINQYTKKSTAFTDSIIVDNMYLASSTGYTTSPVNVHFYEGVGICIEGMKGDDVSGSWVSTLLYGMAGYTEKDFIISYEMSNYGSDSAHPVVASEAEYLANNNCVNTTVVKGNETFGLYRISDVLGRVEVYSPTTTGIKDINTSNTVEANPNAPIYTISGIQVNKDRLSKGIYIQNSKKFVVK